jgi:hypothetical protein
MCYAKPSWFLKPGRFLSRLKRIALLASDEAALHAEMRLSKFVQRPNPKVAVEKQRLPLKDSAK